MADEQDWRLEAELTEEADQHHALETLVEGLRRGDHLADDAQVAVGPAVAITHDGRRLFAYANSEPRLAEARAAIEWLLTRDGIGASVRLSHWDGELAEWRQTYPPLDEAESRRAQASEAAAEQVETQTVVCSAGKIVRASVERVMGEWAQRLGLKCEVVEHSHLLTTQIAFTVTGPHHKLEEFRRALSAEAWATIRADGFGTGLA